MDNIAAVLLFIFIFWVFLLLTCIFKNIIYSCLSNCRRRIIKPDIHTTTERENITIEFRTDPPPYKPMPLPAYSELYPKKNYKWRYLKSSFAIFIDKNQILPSLDEQWARFVSFVNKSNATGAGTTGTCSGRASGGNTRNTRWSIILMS